jgi:hypothetical protein
MTGEYNSDAAHHAQGAGKGDVRWTVEHPAARFEGQRRPADQA